VTAIEVRKRTLNQMSWSVKGPKSGREKKDLQFDVSYSYRAGKILKMWLARIDMKEMRC
jgi:hypothetical protein